MTTKPQSEFAKVPQGWTEASPGGMATNNDPMNGGIIDSRINDNKWFVVFNRDELAMIEGLDSREQAFNAFFERLSRDAMVEVLLAETHRLFRDPSGSGVIQYEEDRRMQAFYPDVERHDGFCRRLTAARFGQVEALEWAWKWYDDLVLEAKTAMGIDFAQRAIKAEATREKVEAMHADLARGVSGNPHMQAYLNTLEDPLSVKSHDYMAWIGAMTNQYEAKPQRGSWGEFLVSESEKQLSERVKVARADLETTIFKDDGTVRGLDYGKASNRRGAVLQIRVKNDEDVLTTSLSLDKKDFNETYQHAIDLIAEHYKVSHDTHFTKRLEESKQAFLAAKGLRTTPIVISYDQVIPIEAPEKDFTDSKRSNETFLVLTISDTSSAAFMDIGRDNEIARIIETSARSLAVTPLEVNDKYAVLDVNDHAVGVVALTDRVPSGDVPDSQARLSIKVSHLDKDSCLPIEVRQTMLDAASKIRAGEHIFTIRSGEVPDDELLAKYECRDVVLENVVEENNSLSL